MNNKHKMLTETEQMRSLISLLNENNEPISELSSDLVNRAKGISFDKFEDVKDYLVSVEPYKSYQMKNGPEKTHELLVKHAENADNPEYSSGMNIFTLQGGVKIPKHLVKYLALFKNYLDKGQKFGKYGYDKYHKEREQKVDMVKQQERDDLAATEKGFEKEMLGKVNPSAAALRVKK